MGSGDRAAAEGVWNLSSSALTLVGMPEQNATDHALERLQRESHEERAEYLEQVRAEAERDDRLVQALSQPKPKKSA
jgi:hypothetical protein